MGDQARLSPTGPRGLEEGDYRADGRPKVIRNPEETLVRRQAPVTFEPVVEPARQQALVALLDGRAGTQRGKPRSQDPARNPLGCRVFDMSCGWAMYRQPYGGSFRYLCGLYQQSHAERCAHNHVDGPRAVEFVLGCLRQRVLSPRLLARLEERLLQRARREQGADAEAQERAGRQAQLAELKGKLERVNRNLALAETAEQFKAVAAVQKELQGQHDALAALLAQQRRAQAGEAGVQAEVDKALALLRRLMDLAGQEGDYAGIGELFRQVNVRLFLRFGEVQLKKRKVNRVAGGVVTFGSAPPPIRPYEGPTGRRMNKRPAAEVAAGPGDLTVPSQPVVPGREGDSSGNVNRGDWIRTSDLLNPIQEVWRVNIAENTSLSRLAAF
jgi:hypothetical protein